MIEFVDMDIPEEARIFPSHRCAKCGELGSRTHIKSRKWRKWCVFHVLRIIHWNDLNPNY